jgi:hypothetical protein
MHGGFVLLLGFSYSGKYAIVVAQMGCSPWSFMAMANG